MAVVLKAWIRTRWRSAARLAAVVATFAAAFWASLLAGAPLTLPEVAMGWMLLFHVERATVLLSAVGVVMLVGWRASHGEFPIRVGQVEYAVKEAAEKSESNADVYERRLQSLEVIAGLRSQGEQDAQTGDSGGA